MMVVFNANYKSILDDLLLGLPGVQPGKMFGYPAFYAGEKLSICLVGEGVGLKLPAERVDQLLAEDPSTSPFQPLGRRKMREWLQINAACAEDLPDYLPVFQESIQYVLQLQEES